MGVRKDASLPTAYVLAKQKRQFKAARPIIDYKRFIFAKLFRATAIVLDLLQKECLPQSYGLQIFPQMVQSLFQFLEQYPEEQQLCTYNQDLVGFFTSIPFDRILRSVEWLVETFICNNHCDPDTYSFSASLKEKDTKLRVWRGRPGQGGARMYRINLRDIVSICELSCQRSFFTVLQKVYKQQRSAAIGNQTSPMLASLTVSLIEQQWFHQHRDLLQLYGSQFLCLRYVDNRIVLLNPLLHRFWAFREFLDDNFYVAPVQLEAVQSLQAQCEFLGFDIRLWPTRSFQLLTQNELWSLKLPSGESTPKQKLALYRSRFRAITKYVWPQRVKDFQLRLLQRTFRWAIRCSQNTLPLVCSYCSSIYQVANMPVLVPTALRKKAEDLLYQQAREEFHDKQIAGMKRQSFLRKIDEHQAYNDFPKATLDILKPHYKKAFLTAIQNSDQCTVATRNQSSNVLRYVSKVPSASLLFL